MTIDINKELDETYGPNINSNLNLSNVYLFPYSWIDSKKSLKSLEKIDLNKEQFICNLLPVKAFVKCEYIKCGKPYCDQDHGPYYCGYWKDGNDKKLHKKYLGRL